VSESCECAGCLSLYELGESIGLPESYEAAEIAETAKTIIDLQLEALSEYWKRDAE
jgi:hypothetical protein